MAREEEGPAEKVAGGTKGGSVFFFFLSFVSFSLLYFLFYSFLFLFLSFFLVVFPFLRSLSFVFVSVFLFAVEG